MAIDPSNPPTLRERLKRPVFLAYALFLLALAQQAWSAPEWSWDLLGYMGSLEEMRGASPAEIHETVFSELDRVAPEEVARDLRHAIDYRTQLSTDAEAFHAQLRFYRGRVVFLGLLAGFESLGLPPIRAAFLISILSGIAFGLLLALMLMRLAPASLGVLAAFIAMKVSGAPSVMAMATPDMLAAALILGGVLALMEGCRWWVATLLFLLALGTRTDHILLVGPLLLWSAWGSAQAGFRAGRMQLGASLALCAAIFLFCTAGRNTYGWWTVFQHTFVEYMAFPELQTPGIDLGFALKRSLQSLPMFKALEPLLFSLVGLASIALGWRIDRLRSRWTSLGALAMFAALAHFALFPALWPRLMLPYWILGWVGLVGAWCESRRLAVAGS
ncbi:MAG: hypothetical protein ACI9F9_000771 [Candidatus Paceibacteria bacterium]|jgi:hypothetical protein